MALLVEGAFLFFTTKEEQKMKPSASLLERIEEENIYVTKEQPKLGKRVDVDINADAVGRQEDKYEAVLMECPEEFSFDLYEAIEAPNPRKSWAFKVKDGFFGYKNKKLEIIPTSIEDEPCFKALDFSINRLTEFPSQLEQVTNLQLLNLSNNRIEEIDRFGKFSNLDYLDLSHNRITEIGEGIASLRKLRHLNLKSNYKLEGIHPRISELKNTLKVLNIKNTKLAKDKVLVKALQLSLPNTEVIYR